jgi:arsenite methyltransferase
MNTIATDETIKVAVRQAYGNVAKRFIETLDQGETGKPVQASCCGPSRAEAEQATPSSCCGTAAGTEEVTTASRCCGEANAAVEVADVVSQFYLAEDITDLPGSVTEAALGCGNPTAIAELQPGEVVLDLGSGGGIDCFIAAKKVGPEGRIIGLDMTPDMIKLARRNAKKVGVKNVDFRYGEMEDIPLPDESVDVIISNCVINLSPDKDAVFREAYRVLRPGGRMSVSDIVVDGEFPPSVRKQMDAWAGCVAGALEETVYLNKLRSAGFEAIEIVSRDYVKAHKIAEGEDIQAHLNECDCSAEALDFKIASVRVAARKPA